MTGSPANALATAAAQERARAAWAEDESNAGDASHTPKAVGPRRYGKRIRSGRTQVPQLAGR